MFKIDQKNVENVLNLGNFNEPVIISRDGIDIAVLISMEDFNKFVSLKREEDFINEMANPHIRIMTDGANFRLSYSEYQKLRDELLEAFDKAFKPDPETLN